MYKCKETLGVDISKDFFDVYSTIHGHYQFANNFQGFRLFRKKLKKSSLVVMEATGYYHFQLAQYLYKRSILVAVVNPLSVKRFLQMKLSKIKTDKSDAKAICDYALVNKVTLYTAKNKTQAECLQLYSLMDSYIKKRTVTKNKLHAEKILGIPSMYVFRSLQRDLEHLSKEITEIENRLLIILQEAYPQQFCLLTSIPGIGIKTALFLIIITNGFSRFETSSQLSSYVGITPTIRESGKSIRGRSRISKVGNKKLRNLLFLCAFTASKNNKSCSDLYNRIIAKGKSKKLALIAVSNKLVKQAFAVVKSGLPYHENYQPSLHVKQFVNAES